MLTTLQLRKIFTWEILVYFAKTSVVICAFLAFAISMRQKELDRFNSIKPLLEIESSAEKDKFRLINRGGIIYFSGCEINDFREPLVEAPRRYSVLDKEGEFFKFSKNLLNGDILISYWRDVDLNVYKLQVILKNDGFYIDGVPLVFRSEQYVTTSRKWLDSLVEVIFPKKWFSHGEIPADSNLSGCTILPAIGSAFEVSGVSPNIPLAKERDAIAQMFNWRYRDITRVIPKLREFGYSYIHVSPPQFSSNKTNKWWGRYQPVDFRKISSPLGSENDFMKMNNEANGNGIGIIADVVFNHMAGGSYKELDSNGKMKKESYPDFSKDDFHPFSLIDWTNKESIENGWLYGDLPDLNTSKPSVRNKLRNYLSKLSDLGVDGFRIDAAVHINPLDLKSILSVIQKDSLIILEMPVDSPLDTITYLKEIPQAGFYDFPLLNTIRIAFSENGELSVLENSAKKQKSLHGKNAITFISNHDIDRGWAVSSEGMKDPKWRVLKPDRDLAYAYLFGREGGLPYVFIDMVNPKPDIDFFPDETYDRPKINAGLRFHNLALGKPESWLLRDKNCVAWQRGKNLLVIINKGKSECQIRDLQTTLLSGEYREIQHGLILNINPDKRIESWDIPSREAFFFVRDDSIY